MEIVVSYYLRRPFEVPRTNAVEVATWQRDEARFKADVWYKSVTCGSLTKFPSLMD